MYDINRVVSMSKGNPNLYNQMLFLYNSMSLGPPNESLPETHHLLLVFQAFIDDPLRANVQSKNPCNVVPLHVADGYAD